MPISEAAKKIRPWAATGDRTDPDDPSLTPPLDEDVGWPDEFSTTLTPRKGVMQELFFRLTTAAREQIQAGILSWDVEVDYVAGACVQAGAKLWISSVATGPAAGNATDPATVGQTVWESVPGRIDEPGPPGAPVGAAGQSEIVWTWPIPRDNGALITGFELQLRVSGGSWPTSGSAVTAPRYVASMLSNGQAYEARVRASNSAGTGDWSPAGSATPSAVEPEQVLCLVPTPGDTEIDLTWFVAVDGGSPLTGYVVQWRSGNQSFSTSRQAIATTNSYTLVGLSNGQQYWIRVAARNAVGDGPWSTTATTTPAAAVVPTPPPVDTAPDAPTNLSGTARRPLLIDFAWDIPADGGERITGFELQWRVSGSSWSGNIVSPTASCYAVAVPSTGDYQARVRAVNSVGTSVWSATASVTQNLDTIPRRVRLTASQNYVWPWDDVDNAVLSLSSPSVNLALQASRDIVLGSGSWRGSASDGTTLWVLDTTLNRAVAWRVSDLSRQTSFDIGLGAGTWQTAVSDGTTLWIVNGNDIARAYRASDQSRQTSLDIDLATGGGMGFFDGSCSDGNTLWFVNTLGSTKVARAYRASDQSRQTSLDINLPDVSGSWKGATSDGVILYFVSATANAGSITAYRASDQSRQTSLDIDLPAGTWVGGGVGGGTIWFIDDAMNTAKAYIEPSYTTATFQGVSLVIVGRTVEWADVAGIANGAVLALAGIGTGDVLDIYPQRN